MKDFQSRQDYVSPKMNLRFISVEKMFVVSAAAELEDYETIDLFE